MTSSTDTVAIIPARYGSSRFPGKPLASGTGKPLIQHVAEQVGRARAVSRVIVATDDQRIEEAVREFGGEAMLTAGDHPNGTSRIAEAARHLQQQPAAILNAQGDEPEVEPEVIDELVEGLLGEPESVGMATLGSPFAEGETPYDPHIVKIVTDRASRALYFSRAPIPFQRSVAEAAPLKHPGIYAYRPAFLQTYASLESSPLERAEGLEQLRALEHGYPIRVVRTRVRHHGIDTPEQYEAFRARFFQQRRSG